VISRISREEIRNKAFFASGAQGMYSVIMAGGRGSRFWPRSRKKSSKQTLNIIGKNTMIQDTVRRLLPLGGPEKILIITNALLIEEIRAQLPEIPRENVIAEPESRSTAPCIGLATALIRHREPGAVMACFAADHLIEDEAGFLADVKFAAQAALDLDALVTFGVPVFRPDTGFGYIHAGEVVRERGDKPARRVLRFVEKPDRETAEKFMKDPDYYINSGIFVWKSDTFLLEMERWLPKMHEGLMKIDAAIGTPFEFKVIGEEFSKFETISVEHGIMEKSDRVVMTQASFGWNDIGSWESLYHVWPKDRAGNAAIGRKLAIDTEDCLIYSPKKLVAAIGLKDIIIVETDDALLVCRKDRAQDVSRLIEELRKKRWEEYL
jgi:mannose-1-phosphate guanylyltransferase